MLVLSVISAAAVAVGWQTSLRQRALHVGRHASGARLAEDGIPRVPKPSFPALSNDMLVDADGFPLSGGAAVRRQFFDLNRDGVLSAEELELAVNRLTVKVNRSNTDRDIIIQFDLYAEQFWRRYRGTVWEVVWPRLLGFGVYPAATCVLIHASAPVAWDMLTVPAAGDVPLLRLLQRLDTTWGYLSSVTTFTLTFFLSKCCAIAS